MPSLLIVRWSYTGTEFLTTAHKINWRNFRSSSGIGISDPIMWYTWPWILNVVSKLCPSDVRLQVFVAPKDVIWKQELNLRVLRKNNFESSNSPARSDFKGSGGVRRGDSTDFSDAQHMPVDLMLGNIYKFCPSNQL